MRARLAFTTALMTHVDVLLIDEILSVGDAHFRGKAQAAMMSRVTGDQTVVFVSHMADQVKQLCNRVIWLDKGKIVAQGDAAEVVDAYTQHVTQARVDGALQQTALQQQFEAKLQADPKLQAAFKQQIEAKIKADAQQQVDTKE